MKNKKRYTLTFFLLFYFSIHIYAQLPSKMYPQNGARVTNPFSFSWQIANGNGDIYLNVSTFSDMSQINVVNWHDDGTHYYSTSSINPSHKGLKLYWQLASKGLFSPIRSFTVGETSIDPFYNVVQMAWPANSFWQPNNPDTMTIESLNLIKNTVGSVGNTLDRKLGFGVSLPFFYCSTDQLKLSLNKIFLLAETTGMPAYITLDGYEFWNSRPDLWNWYDNTKPGYDIENKNNVEWKGWNKDFAVKEGYRNWGSLFNTGMPHPNLASPKVIAESKKALSLICPYIANWYKNLPQEKKYLFAGIKIGWEVGIGINYFYPSASTPDASEPWTKCDQIGYAAVKTSGLASSGTLTTAQIDIVVSKYQNELAMTANEFGIPRNKLYTHVGIGDDSTSLLKFQSSLSAFCEFAMPGWSLYSNNNGPLPIKSALDNKNWNTWWATAEWGGGDYNTFRNFERFRNNKLLNSYVGPMASQLIGLINTSPQASASYTGWMHPPILKANASGSTVQLNWDISAQTERSFLNVSTNKKMNEKGSFEIISVLNVDVTGSYTKTLQNLTNGVYYCMVITDGFGRRVHSDIITITVINGNATVSRNSYADSTDAKNTNNQNDINKIISIYPNPAENTISIITQYKLLNITILDIQGRIVKIFADVNDEIDITDVQKGLYILKIDTDNGTAIEKIIKK